ncbi:fumarylacetoacetate hydrolase family protein [Streptomyces sp. NPDC054864]
MSARDAQFSDGQWFRGKNFDGFCPLGPWIATEQVDQGDPAPRGYGTHRRPQRASPPSPLH